MKIIHFLVGSCALFAAAGATAQNPITNASFSYQPSLYTDTYPRAMVSADIDGDGKPDLVTVNQMANTMSIFRNTSVTGTFQFATRIDIPVAVNCMTVVAADINGDGKRDLLLGEYNDNKLSIYQNASTAGNISFLPKVSYNTGTNPGFLVVSDFDADGKTDVAAIKQNSYNVSIFRNVSSGASIAFTYSGLLPAGNWPMQGAAGDLDGDGKPDLAVANNTAGTVSLLRNTSQPGSISFAPQVTLPNISTPWSCAIGDLDNDGKQELCISSNSMNQVYVYRNASTPGSFSLSLVQTLSASNPLWVTIGELNYDNKPDLAVACFQGNGIALFQNSSNSSALQFSQPYSFATDQYTRYVCITDIDGDGRNDLAASNSISSSINLYRNQISVSGTAVSDLFAESGIRMYPNPATAFLRLDLSGATNRWERVGICNSNGALIQSQPLRNAAQAELDLRSLSPGTYYLLLEQRHKRKLVPFVKL